MSKRAFSYIRWSRPDQREGDSLRRQTEGAERYAEEHGLTLDTSLRPDDGLSAFSGAHRTKGALGQFLKAVEAGRIPKGSILIVEDVDRLSREQMMDALNLFTQIINADIKVVTLKDRQEFTRESINATPMQLVGALLGFVRGHDESATKSKRVGEAWKAKRTKAESSGIPLTAKAPAWLYLPKRTDGGDETRRFEIIPERAETVNLIYRMRLDGKGPARIERELNNGSKPPWAPDNGWRKSYIVKILQNRAVLGEFQPHRKVKDKRIQHGEPIINYFPRIVDGDTFHAVQAMRKGGHKGGPTGKARNLFTYITRCGFCGAKMVFVDKGKPPRGRRYMVCDNAKRGLGCEYRSMRYDEIEDHVLNFCKGLNVADVLTDDTERNNRIAGLKTTIAATENKLEEAQRRVDNLTDQISTTESPQARTLYEQKLLGHLDEIESLKRELPKVQREFEEVTRATEDTAKRIENLRELQDQLKDDDSVDLRLRLREELRRLVKQINIYPAALPTRSYPGDPRNWEPSDQEDEDFMKMMEADDKANRAGRRLKVWFKSGGYRVLFPEREHPLVQDWMPRRLREGKQAAT